MYSILCVQRGQLIESVRQYDSDEEDLDASRLLLWPDRGDGRSYQTREDYEDDEEYNPMSLEQIREDIRQRVRAAQLAARPVRVHLDHKQRRKNSSDASYEEDYYQEEVVEAQGEALLCKTVPPEDSAIDLGYSADDEDFHRSGTTTPHRRSPDRSKEPPEINRGYVAESSVVVYGTSPAEERRRSASPCDTQPPLSPTGSPPHDPEPSTKPADHSPSVLLILADGDDDESDDDDSGDHDKEYFNSGAVRHPISDTVLYTSRPSTLYDRGTQSCCLVDDQSNPFRPTPGATEDIRRDLLRNHCPASDRIDIPIVDERANFRAPSPTFRRSSVDRSFAEKTPSDDEEEEEEEDKEESTQDSVLRRPSPDFSLDFGASILAARPLVMAPPPPSPPLPAALAKHSRDDEDDDEGPTHDPKRSRPECEYDGDFGASILASKPIVMAPPPPQVASTAIETLDFGASILASRPLVMARPPPPPCDSQVLDFGASILASKPLVMAPPPPPPPPASQVLDFGASILAARPLVMARPPPPPQSPPP